MNRTQGNTLIYVAALSLLAACSSQPSRVDIPAHAVVGVSDAQLRPEFWIAREPNAKKVVLDSQAIAALNARVMQLDPTVHDLKRFSSTLSGADVRSWIGKLSQYPDDDVFDAEGRKYERSQLDALMQGLALESVPESQRTRYGLVVKRAALRTFPTTQ